MNILIRDLTPAQEEKLEEIKNHFGEKTNAKAVLKMLSRFMEVYNDNSKLSLQAGEANRQLSSIKECVNNIEWNVNLMKAPLGLDDNDEEYDSYD